MMDEVAELRQQVADLTELVAALVAANTMYGANARDFLPAARRVANWYGVGPASGAIDQAIDRMERLRAPPR